MEPQTPLKVNPDTLAALAAKAEAAAADGKFIPLDATPAMTGPFSNGRRTRTSTHRPGSPRPAAPRSGPLVLGPREPVQCDDCSTWVAPELREVTPGISVWQLPRHTCPERSARQQWEAAAEAEVARRELERPSPARVAAVLAAAHLPCETPRGWGQVQVQLAYAAAHAKLQEHREQWLAGQRPRKGLWLTGPTNQRKTTCLSAFCFDVALRTQQPVQFWNFENVMSEKAKQAQGRRGRWDLDLAENARLLALDDIGRTTWTAAAYRTIHGLLEHAMSDWGQPCRTQTVYVTSNESPGTLQAILNQLPDYEDAGDTLVRRLVQLCDVVTVGA